MKKIIAFILSLLVITFVISGCDSKEIISQKPMELRFTPAHSGVENDIYMIGDYIITVPKTVAYPDKYEVRYFITYEDSSTEYKWIEPDKTTYEKARDKLPP